MAPEEGDVRGCCMQEDGISRMFGGAASLVREALAKGKQGAKDLVVETERTSPQPASYAVAPASVFQDGGMITVRIKLRHQ